MCLVLFFAGLESRKALVFTQLVEASLTPDTMILLSLLVFTALSTLWYTYIYSAFWYWHTHTPHPTSTHLLTLSHALTQVPFPHSYLFVFGPTGFNQWPVCPVDCIGDVMPTGWHFTALLASSSCILSTFLLRYSLSLGAWGGMNVLLRAEQSVITYSQCFKQPWVSAFTAFHCSFSDWDWRQHLSVGTNTRF